MSDRELTTKIGDSTSISDRSFESLNISDRTKNAVKKLGFSTMTEIQAKSIPLIMSDKDVIGAAKTGSGKTLSFLIPSFDLLHRDNFKQKYGTGVLIISPTRELALQIFGVAKEIGKEHPSRNIGIVMGGCNRAKEAKMLSKNVSLLVATPGRLLDHLKNTKKFVLKKLKLLVIDEADRILDNGFEQEMNRILDLLPEKRQTVLFSATQTKKTKDLAKLSFKKTPFYVGVDDKETHSTRLGLKQGFVIVEPEKKFLLLYSFLRRNRRKKTIVFLSTCSSTRFFAELLNYIDIPVLELHGKLKQSKRTSTFFEFCNAKNGCLLATDVAARGLDVPEVDWIIQYDPPDDPKSYIHRVGRTARGLNGRGKALIFLQPTETKFLQMLSEKKVPMKEFNFPKNKISDVQSQLESLIENNFYLAKSAKEAFRSYLQSYAQMTNKEIFDVHSLDVLKVVKSFGFDTPPKVNLNISLGGKKTRKRLLKKQIEENNSGLKRIRSIKQFCR